MSKAIELPIPSRVATLRQTALLPSAAIVLIAAGASPTFAQSAGEIALEELVIEGASLASTPVNAATVGTAVTVITGEEIERRGSATVSDVLRYVPGLAVSRPGPAGIFTQVRLRGAEANHVLVLIDGVEVSDPSSGEFDFSTLPADNIERIEVLRGAQSALWGANATAGVINIITKRAEPGTRAAFRLEGGSFSTGRVSGSLSASSDWARGIVTASGLKTAGTEISPTGTEDDGFELGTLGFKGGIDLSKNFSIDGAVRMSRSDSEFDEQLFAFTPIDGTVVDWPNRRTSDQIYANTRAKLKLFDDRWINEAFFRFYDVNNAAFENDLDDGANKGDRINYGYLSTFNFETPGLLGAKHTLVGQVERKVETFRNTGQNATAGQRTPKERGQTGFVAEYRISLLDSLFLSGAYRHDDNDTFQDTDTYRATAAYKLKPTGTRFHASIGTGVTNPTMVEQFGFFPGSFIPNPNLTPEKSRSWDAGIEQTLFDGKLVVDVTYFEADLTNEIVSTFDFTTFLSSVDNLDEDSSRRGVEVALTARPTPYIDLTASYTFLDATQTRNGIEQVEVRRPRHQASFAGQLRFLDDKARFNLGVVYNGEAEDNEFLPATPQTIVTLDDYVLVTASGEYDLSDAVTWYARVENALDEDYQEVFGFDSPGVAGYTGVKIRLGQ